jgi:hypothetical protein
LITHTVARKKNTMIASKPYIELNKISRVKSLPGAFALVTIVVLV